jgi:hypothetical protein
MFRRVVSVVVAVLSTVTLVASPAAGQSSERPCGTGAPLVDVVYRVVNEQDLASNGDVWALDAAVSHFRLYQTGEDTFCAAITIAGEFTAFGGPSPAGTGVVPAGHSGRFAGVDTLYLTGTFAPSLPTRGFVGTFDGQCDQFECQTPVQFGRNYVEVTGPPEHGAYRFIYASACGVWIATNEGDRGDIAC